MNPVNLMASQQFIIFGPVSFIHNILCISISDHKSFTMTWYFLISLWPKRNVKYLCLFWHEFILVSHGGRLRMLDIWKWQWQPTPVLLPGKSHGWRSLVGCSPWDHKESDTTEWLHFHFSLSYLEEGNGNPLQCSCLENPRDGGAWWAAISGVAQSQTQLKRLSSKESFGWFTSAIRGIVEGINIINKRN